MLTFEHAHTLTTGNYTPTFCRYCGEVDEHGGLEPDARLCYCDNCGTTNRFGLEEAIISGWVVIN